MAGDKKQLNFLERVIEVLSPALAFKRRTAVAMLEQFDSERKYSGASFGPLTEDWHSNMNSARAEISFDILELRNRMRELVRNDGYAFSAVQSLAANIVGKGIRPYFSGNNAIKDKIERPFLDWCNSINCDLAGSLNFYGLQQLAIKGTVESGEVLVVKRYVGRGFKAKLALQVLEVDFIVHWYTNSSLGEDYPPGTYVINGVYYDKNDRVYGYEVYLEHPGDSLKVRGYKHRFISANDAVLIFRPERPGQTRGVPTGASAMLEHKMLNQYELSQAHRQTIAASYAAFVKTMNPAEFGTAPVSGNPERDTEMSYHNYNGERIKPGSIQYLLPGEDVTLATPPPVEGYDEYIRSRLRKIARAWGLSYEVVSGDLKQVNFSSGRMGWIEMHRNIESWQTLIMIPKLCNVVWDWWLELEQLKGTVPLNTQDLRVDWTPPRREMIDPVKETKAMIDQIQAGLLSYPDAIRQLGNDPEIQMNLIAENNATLDSLKLTFIRYYRNIQKQNTKAPAKDGL